MGLDNVKSEPLAFQVTFIYEKDEPKVLWQCKDCGHLNNLPSQLKRAIGNS